MGELYCITSPSGKSYVGITRGTAENRFKQHGRAANRGQKNPFHNAWRKYGKENMTLQVLNRSDDWSELCALENVAIIMLGTKAPKGMNSTMGGEGMQGYSPPIEVRRKLSIASRKVAENPEYRKLHSDSGKKRWEDIDFRKKQADGVRKLMQDPEHIKKLIERTKRMNADPDYVARRSATASVSMRGRNAKLTEEDVREIKRLQGLNVKGRDIAKQFNISVQNLTGIKKGRRWAWVV